MSLRNHPNVELEIQAIPSRSLSFHAVAKRIVDFAGAFCGLVLLLPVMMAISIIIKFTDPKGTVFFKQKRIGRYGNLFSIYKFRSMISNAEERLKQDPALYAKYVANNYKLDPDEDPRITRIGRFLRKTSLDELPQLVNVLKGEMSLVGPRPIVKDELREYGSQISEFLSVKPGVTGYWQVCGRSDVGYPERVDLELHYVYHQSLLFDIKILFKTVWIVLLKRGAY
jgi:exopolysaccharide production protein ExoY